MTKVGIGAKREYTLYFLLYIFEKQILQMAHRAVFWFYYSLTRKDRDGIGTSKGMRRSISEYTFSERCAEYVSRANFPKIAFLRKGLLRGKVTINLEFVKALHLSQSTDRF